MQGMPVLRPPLQRREPLALNRATLLRLVPNVQDPHFTDLDLRKLNIVSIDPNTFTGLVHLEIIRLDHNSIQVILSETFANLPRLHTLYLNLNSIQLLSTNSFNNLPLLRILQLSRNQIATITNPTTFNNLPSLQLINLNGNPLNVAQVSDAAFHLVHPSLVIEFEQRNHRIPLRAPAQAAQAAQAVQVVVGGPDRPNVSTCPICFEELKDMIDERRNPVPIYTLSCGHLICSPCYHRMPPAGDGIGGPVVKRCPTCRIAAPEEDARRTFLGGYKEKYLKYKEKYLQLKNKL